MAMVAFAITCYAILWLTFHKINTRRENGEEEYLVQGMTDEDIAEMGDDSPRFRYTI
jgi:hypothetical protein